MSTTVGTPKNLHIIEEVLKSKSFLNIIKQHDQRRIHLVNSPVVNHMYLSLSGEIKRLSLAVNSYKLNMRFNYLDMSEVEIKETLKFMRQELYSEIDRFLDQSTVLYLYTIYSMMEIDGLISLRMRFTTVPDQVCIETAEGVDMFMNKLGINEFLKKYEDVLIKSPGIGRYIKGKYRDIRDKVDLWERLHGVPVMLQSVV